MVRPLYMGLQVTLLGEGCGTVGAFVRPVAAVFLQVYLQGVLLVEGLVADLADKRTLS